MVEVKMSKASIKSAADGLRFILAAQGVTSGTTSPPSLDNPIHPIFARGNWPKDIRYKNWEQTLKLASLFLTEPNLMDFWVQAALGDFCAWSGAEWSSLYSLKVEGDTVDSDPAWSVSGMMKKGFFKMCGFNQAIPTYLSDIDVNGDTIKQTQQVLLNLAGKIRFSRKGPGEKGIWGRYDHSCRSVSWKASDDNGRKGLRLDFYSDIRLCKALWEFFDLDPNSRDTQVAKSQQLLIMFMGAVTICHEVAHALIAERMTEVKKVDKRQAYFEPFHNRADYVSGPEAGFSWEKSIFGGSPDNNGAGGLRKVDSIGGFGLMMQSGKELTFIEVEWVNFWFRKKNWEKIRTTGRSVIPPVGGRRVIAHVAVPAGWLYFPYLPTRVFNAQRIS